MNRSEVHKYTRELVELITKGIQSGWSSTTMNDHARELMNTHIRESILGKSKLRRMWEA